MPKLNFSRASYQVVRKTDGKRPTIGAISGAAKTFMTEKETVGRPLGKNKTTKREDRQILTAFKKVPMWCSRRF